MVVVAEVGEGVDVPDTGAVDRHVEHSTPHGIPVAVDVLGSRGASTGLFVVGDHRGDGVTRGGEVQEGHLRHGVPRLIAVVEEVQALCERRLQTGVTT